MLKTTLNMLSINWYILSRLKAFSWMLALWFVSLITILILIYYLPNIDPNLIFFVGAFKFPFVYNTISVFALLPTQLIIVLQILFICKDFSNKTYRLFIINGTNKSNLLLQNLALSVSLCLLSTVIIYIIATLAGFIFGGEMVFYSMRWVGIFFVQIFCLSVYGIAIAIIVKDVGIASFIYLVWFGIVERLLGFFLNYTLKLHPLGSLLPGNNIECKSNLVIIKDMVHQVHIPAILDWGLTFFWVMLALFIIRNAYIKTRF